MLPSSGESLPFRNFGWDIVNTVAKEFDGKRPITFQLLKRAAIDKPIKPLSDRPRDHYLKMAHPSFAAEPGRPLARPAEHALAA